MPDTFSVDDLYVDGRRRLLLQTYALTGDLAVARTSVRDAYVAAAQRWGTVGQLPDPEGWVRDRAWSRAQRRHAPRRWHRERGLGEEQRAVHEALQHLSDRQRKVLLLVHLAGLGPAEVALELGVPRARVERGLERSQRRFLSRYRGRLSARTRATGVPDQPLPEGPEQATAVIAALERLLPLVEQVSLPPAETVRRQGQLRGRLRLVGGTVAAVVVTLVGGLLVVSPSGADPVAAPDDDRAAATTPVSPDMLLTARDARVADPRQGWRETGTGDNTEGDGINNACQASRFADPDGEGTLVRKFVTEPQDGLPTRTLVQTVEVSGGLQETVDAYETTLGWFAGCRQARLQLLGSYRVGGIGTRAEVLQLRIPSPERQRSYVIGITRSDRLTVSTVVETVGGSAVGVRRSVALLRRAVGRLCEADAAGSCPTRTRVSRVLPPPSGETPGTLAAADLPPVGRVDAPWVGTRPLPAQPNGAATTCDGTEVDEAARSRSRTYLIPQADLPDRFGLTQTVATYRRPVGAERVFDSVVEAMRACEDEDLSATIAYEQIEPDGFRDSTIALWRLDSEVREDETVSYWMGVARVGRHVTQVLFTPIPRADMDADAFRAVVLRSRDRLFELESGTR